MTASLRTRTAIRLGQAVSELSRRAGRGQGSSVGGKVMLAVDPQALAAVATGHRVAMVSGTNGKTTTTRLLAAALSAEGPVTSNSAGANLLSGLVSTLAGAPPGALGALEVDEGLLPAAVTAIRPVAVVLLNLSRDQLDRIGEVRLHAESWRRALAASPATVAVANADDPLVAYAAHDSAGVTWVGTGQQWRSDAAACPACGGRIKWAVDGQWACDSCDFSKPSTTIDLDGNDLVLPGGARLTLDLQLPGWCNRANAAMALGGAIALGANAAGAVAAMSGVGTVAGRYQVLDRDGVQVRLLLAKNPAGWAETLDLIRPAPLPVVIGINARVADGRDPSWLWDVPFERLRGRLVIATGDRGRDLAVRLRYADVEHGFVPDYLEAVRATGESDIDLAANYTSFQDARRALGGSGVSRD
ncbi:MAG TPA: MurT ligase domain-containing protein [Acidimicrobiales bacterium]|nr:MurT ligase domain-containing protein [Acidimicrobiales bacterium]